MGNAVVTLAPGRAREISVVFVAGRVAKGAREVQPRFTAELARGSSHFVAGPVVGSNGVADGLTVILARLECSGGGGGSAQGGEGGRDEEDERDHVGWIG